MKIVFTDADGFADNNEPAIVVLTITRKDVESRNLASAIERLHVLTDSRENVVRYRESVLFQVDGYDDDPRELTEIPEARAYFRALAAEWPHWLWFLHRHAGAVALLMAMLCEISVLRGPGGRRGTAFRDTREIHRTMLDLLERGLPLFDAYEIAPAEIDAAVMSAVADLGLQDDVGA